MSQHSVSHVEPGQMQLGQRTTQIQTRLMMQQRQAQQQAQQKYEQRQQQTAVPVSNRPQFNPQQLAQLKVQMPMRYQQYMAQMKSNQQMAQSQQQQQQQRMIQQHQAVQKQAALNRARRQHAAAQQMQMSRSQRARSPSPQPQSKPASQHRPAPTRFPQPHMRNGAIHNDMFNGNERSQNSLTARQLEQLRQQKYAQLRRNSSRGEQSEEIAGTKSMFSDDSGNNAMPLHPDYGHGIFLNGNENDGHTYGLSLNHKDGHDIFLHDIEQRNFVAESLKLWEVAREAARTGLPIANESDGTILSDSAISQSASRDSPTQPKASVQHRPSPSKDRKARSVHSPVPPKSSSRRRHKVQTSSKESTPKTPTIPLPSTFSYNINSTGVVQEEDWIPQILSSTDGVSTTLHEEGPDIQGIWTSYTISEDHTGGSEAISQLRLAALRRKEFSLIHFQETRRFDTDDAVSTYIMPINTSSLNLQPGRGGPEYESLRDFTIKPDHFGIGPHDPSFNVDSRDDGVLETLDVDSFLSTAIDKVDFNGGDFLENFDFDSFLNTTNEKWEFRELLDSDRVDGGDYSRTPFGMEF